jgi:hypothetical protein
MGSDGSQTKHSTAQHTVPDRGWIVGAVVRDGVLRKRTRTIRRTQ